MKNLEYGIYKSKQEEEGLLRNDFDIAAKTHLCTIDIEKTLNNDDDDLHATLQLLDATNTEEV